MRMVLTRGAFLACVVCAAFGSPAPAPAQQAQADGRVCTTFTSHGRLRNGESFSASLPRGFELRLAASPGGWGWDIAVTRPGGKYDDYMWVVSPPLVTGRAHVQIGPGYGLGGKASASFTRRLRFVLSDDDYAAAVKSHTADDADVTLKRLGQGSLTLRIVRFETRPLPNEPPPHHETLDWIEFTGEACVPAPR